MFEFLAEINKKGFFHLLISNYFVTFLGFASQLFVIKFLSPIQMGQVKTLQSFVAVISIFVGCGFNTSILKICSEKIEVEKKKKLLSLSIFHTLWIGGIALLLVFFLSKFNIFSPDKGVNYWLQIYILIVPSTVLVALFITYLQALKKIKLMAQVQSIIRFLGVFCIIVSTYFYNMAGYIVSSIIVSYFGLLGIVFIIRHDLTVKYVFNDIEKELKSRLYSYSFWSAAGNIIGSIAMYMDIFVLNSFAIEREKFGYYSIATIFILGLNQITATIQSIATPYFSERSYCKSEFLRVLKKYLRIMILGSLGVSALAFYIIPFLITSIYGDNYRFVGNYFRILLLKYLFWSSYTLIGVAILSIGKMKFNFFVTLVTTLIAFIIVYYAAKNFSIDGVAYGQALSYFINLIIIYIFGYNYIIRYFNYNR